MIMRLRFVVELLATLASIAGSGTTSHAQARPERGPAILEVARQQGVSLEVLDWGGSGSPLVFLAGGGNSTPYDFDDFAPRFTGSHRVIGITRRGNGGSSAQRPQRFDDYVDDIAAVLDTLHFDRVVLIGHSFAGLEMARFGEKYGRRCAALIYLDAAYDYTDPALEKIFENDRPPSAPPMQYADSASIDAVRDWLARTQRFRPPISAVRATRLWAKDGRLIGPKPSPADSWSIPNPTPRWDRVACPSLGIYAMPKPYQTYLRYWPSLDSLQRARANDYYALFAPWTKKNRDAFGRLTRNRVVEFPSASHYFFMEQPDEAARVIDEFLSSGMVQF
jgi:pimeloyl-ACP methyl ester carboxylesterase